MREALTPVERFNAQIQNAVLEYNQDGEGRIVLSPDELYGMVSQFLKNPTGTASAAGVEIGEETASLLKISSGQVEPAIGTNAKGVATASVSVSNVQVTFGDKQFSTDELFVEFTQSKKLGRVELSVLRMKPDIPIASLGLPIPVPGNIGGVVWAAFGGENVMLPFYESTAVLVMEKGADSKPKRVDIEILPDKGEMVITIIKNGFYPNYPESMQYKVLKTVAESLAKKKSE